MYDKPKLLYYAQLASAILSGVVSVWSIYNLIRSGYLNNPNFFKSKVAKRLLIVLVLLVIISTLTYIKITKWAKTEEKREEGIF